MAIQQIGRTVTCVEAVTTSNAAWVVPTNIVRGPSGIALLYVTGCAAGGGGGGGNATPGGGGGGGGAGLACEDVPFMVTPGESLAIQIGIGRPGGAIGAAATDNNSANTTITGSLDSLYLRLGGAGSAGANPNGGNGGTTGQTTGGSGGAGAGGAGTHVGGPAALTYSHIWSQRMRYSTGSAGGALNYNGGLSPKCIKGDWGTVSAATGGSSGGGGGAGGSGPFGTGGAGGNNGAEGSVGTGYGAGGGGGSGNAAGAAGTNGILWLRWDAYQA